MALSSSPPSWIVHTSAVVFGPIPAVAPPVAPARWRDTSNM